MSHPERKRRCRTCGNSWFQSVGERTQCPYTLMHERALQARGLPLANSHPAAVKLRTIAVKFTNHTPARYDPEDKVGRRLNTRLLAAARAYARVASHAEALLKSTDP